MESKKIVDVLILGGCLVASQAAFATAACTNGTATAVTAGSFVVQGFPVKCSANVDVDYNQASATTAGVKGMSRKGMHSFGGDVTGGAVKACETTSAAYAAPTASATGC